MLAGSLNTLQARDPAAEAETVEILQVALSKPAQHQFQQSNGGQARRCQMLRDVVSKLAMT